MNDPTPPHSGNPEGEALDIDGDGVADVFVPGLSAHIEPDTVDLTDSQRWDAVVSADMPPATHPSSPMGQIEHGGYALRSKTARKGWRRPLIVAFAWFWLLALMAGLALTLGSVLFR